MKSSLPMNTSKYFILLGGRFGDFVSDEVVAPVRETCAQTLGVTLQHMSVGGVERMVSVFMQLLTQIEWEVRHGGLLGLKYLLAVRKVTKNPYCLQFVRYSITIFIYYLYFIYLRI